MLNLYNIILKVGHTVGYLWPKSGELVWSQIILFSESLSASTGEQNHMLVFKQIGMRPITKHSQNYFTHLHSFRGYCTNLLKSSGGGNAFFFLSVGRDLVTHELPQWFRSAWDCRLYHSLFVVATEEKRAEVVRARGIVTRQQPVVIQCPGKRTLKGRRQNFSGCNSRRPHKRLPGKGNLAYYFSSFCMYIFKRLLSLASELLLW